MAATIVNWIFLILAFVTMVPGVALLWRTFHADDQLTGKIYRLANYETCGFLFVWVLSALAVYFLKAGKSATVVRATMIGVMIYVTIYAVFTNFNNLNNLRIVDMGLSSKSYYYPTQELGSTIGPVDRVSQRRFLGGLILGYFSLLFSLLATNTGMAFYNLKGGITIALYIVALIIVIPGVIVCWSNSSIAPYPTPDSTKGVGTVAANSDPIYLSSLVAQNLLFAITTFAMMQWIVLTVGLMGAAEEIVLLNASGFIYGIGNLFAPVAFFMIQSTSPGDADFLWAGPILCWIGGAVFVAVAALANTAQKEASV